MLNDLDVLTPAHWRRLDPALRAALLEVLGPKAGILNHQVLDLAKALCANGAHDLALAMYRALHGDPEPPYECGLGAMVTLRCHYMGEDMESWLYGSEETPLLLPTRRLPRGAQEEAR